MISNFLNIFKKRLAQRNEDGAGLITILGVSMVVLIVAASVTTSAAVSTTFTYSQLQSQQASEHADTGLTEAIATLSSGDKCINAKAPTDDEPYGYNIYYSISKEKPSTTNTEDGTYERGCPIEGISQWILIESYGEGRNQTLTTKQAVFEVAGIGGNVLPHAMTAGIMNFQKIGELNTANGLTSNQPSLYVSNPNANSILCSSSPENPVKADFYWNNDIIRWFDCSVEGNVKVASGLSVRDSANIIKGDVCSPLHINDTGNKVQGEKIRNNPDCGFYGGRYGYQVKPEAVDLKVTKTSECNNSLAIVQNYINNNPGKKIIDLTQCSSNWNSQMNKELIVNDDTTILFNRISISNLKINSTSNKNVTVNLVTPSGTADANDSTCTSGTTTPENFSRSSYGAGVHGMVYTPCNLDIDSSHITGQIYSGGTLRMTNSDNTGAYKNTTLTYMPSALPDAVVNIQDSDKKSELIRVD